MSHFEAVKTCLVGHKFSLLFVRYFWSTHGIYIHGVSSLGGSALPLLVCVLWFDSECLVQALSPVVILSFELLAVYPFEVARTGIVFPFFESCPWILRCIGIRGNDGLHESWFKTLFEVVDRSMIVELYFCCCGKSFELCYEYIQSVWSMFELDEAVKCLLLPVGVGKGVFECLFELCPVDFFGVCNSSGDVGLEFSHLFLFPWLHHISLHVGKCGGDPCGWVAHGLVLSIGKSEDAKCD